VFGESAATRRQSFSSWSAESPVGGLSPVWNVPVAVPTRAARLVGCRADALIGFLVVDEAAGPD